MNLPLKKYTIIISLFLTSYLFTQEKNNEHIPQVWIGYMTSIRISPKISLWNDIHFVNENFLIGRHGVSYHINRNAIITGGYAWLFLSTSFTDKLVRNEHRPWGQIMLSFPMEDGWQIQNRVRYDARFRQTIENGELSEEEYTFNHRLRYMINVRKSLDIKLFGNTNNFISVNNEVLLNFGKNVTGINNLDQFRASLLFGGTKDNITVQLGYMYRYMPLSTVNHYRHYHALTLWINHIFNTKHYDDMIRTQ